MLFNKLFFIVIFSIFISTKTYAATVESLQIEGNPTITETDVYVISHIPDTVVTLFHQKGGHIAYVSARLEQRYEVFDYKVYGLYDTSKHKIYIRSGAEVGGIVAHELAHFLYHETYPSWTSDIKALVDSYGIEKFAEAYCLYCRCNTTGLPDMDNTIDSIHKTAEKLSKIT